MYTNPIPTREQWQQIRNQAKVPKGAAKVSIGDSIAKVHKSFTPASIDANLAASNQLVKDLDLYINTVKTKYPGFDSVVTTKVKNKVQGHIAILKDVVKAKTEFYPRYADAEKAWKAFQGGAGTPKDVANKLVRLKGCVDTFAHIDAAWDNKRVKTQQIFQMCDSAAALNANQKKGVEDLLTMLKP